MFEKQRQAMVDGQLRTNKVTDPAVLDAFIDVPREVFAPEGLQGSAYVDEDLDLGHGRVLIEPMVAARILQAADVTAGKTCLIIGAGNGYLATLLSHMGAAVTAWEPIGTFAAAGRQLVPQVTWLEAGFDQLPAQRFDRVFTGGSVSALPAAWVDLLTPDGRAYALIEGAAGNDGRAVEALASADGAALSARTLFFAAVPPMPEFAAAQAFEF